MQKMFHVKHSYGRCKESLVENTDGVKLFHVKHYKNQRVPSQA